MIYQVMLRIIDQSIPDSAINNPVFQWNPLPISFLREERGYSHPNPINGMRSS